MNNEVTSLGERICEVILIDGYSLCLRYDRIRDCVNSKLQGLALDGIYAQVGVDECFRLVVAFYIDKVKTGDAILIKEGLNDDSEKESVNKKTKFIEDINNAFYNTNLIQLKKMKKLTKGVTPSVTKDERNSVAQDVAKFVSLCKSEYSSILEKIGVDISETCRKMTNGAIESFFVQEGEVFFSNNLGLSMSFNSVGRTEEEFLSVITVYINSMMELSEMLTPLGESVNVTDTQSEEPVAKETIVKEPTVNKHAKSGKAKTTSKCGWTKPQMTKYNECIAETFEALDISPDINKRSFSQQVRSKMLHCAHDAGLKVTKKASIELLVSPLTSDNIQRMQNMYDLYKHETPAWFARFSDKGVPKKISVVA